MEQSRDRFVLVVDDDPDIRETLELLLERHGHAVVSAEDGAAALERLRGAGSRPCVILLDLMMPGMNGFQFQEALIAEPAFASVPIVVITGGGSELERRAREFTSEVLHKPFEMKAMLSAVGRHCPAGA
jgi:two-component system chemotaxis response regulator CheY